jgi:hypothetical protein
MKRRTFLPLISTLGAGAWFGLHAQPGWATLLDGTSLDGWNAIGDADWRVRDGAIEATRGDGYLLTAANYKDFELHAEFWTDEVANSGVFLRCQSRSSVLATNSYEVNVYDKRPDPKFGTGAIVNVAPAPVPAIVAAGKWNTFDITARGMHLVVELNGVKTVDVEDAKFAEGPLAIQRTAGVVRFRKVAVRPL